MPSSTWTDLEFYGQVNALKAGILYATAVTTVSPRYSREIQTPEFGCGLDGLLRHRAGGPARHPERRRLQGLGPGDRSPHPPQLRAVRPRRQESLPRRAGPHVRPHGPRRTCPSPAWSRAWPARRASTSSARRSTTCSAWA
ncbi:MAG: glycogen/starch synthase [Chromatiales bacterium]|nr:glycogen/starch synthase [Chromatiales bacterium]